MRFEHLGGHDRHRRAGLPACAAGRPARCRRGSRSAAGRTRACRRTRCRRRGAGSTTAAPSTSTGCARTWEQRQKLEERHPEIAGDQRPILAHEGRYERRAAAARRPGARDGPRHGHGHGTGTRRGEPVAEQPVAGATERTRRWVSRLPTPLVRAERQTEPVSLQPVDRAAATLCGPTCCAPSTARCASTPPSRAMWSADASNYRRVPIGVVAPARRRGRRGGRVRVPRARRAGAAGRRADLDRGPGRQHRRRAGLPAREPDPRDRPGRPHRPRRARRDLRRGARRRRAARAHASARTRPRTTAARSAA